MGAPLTVFFIGHEADSVFVSGLGFSPCDCVRMSITPAKQKEEAQDSESIVTSARDK